MIQELRVYETKVGHAQAYTDLFEERGFPIATRFLTLAGFWTSEFGDLNEVFHMWTFESHEQRLQARASLHGDPSWREFVPLAQALVVRQRNYILKPSRFSPTLGSGLQRG